MRERTNVNRYPLEAEGPYTLTVDGVPEKRRSQGGKTTYRVWKYTYFKDGIQSKMTHTLFPWESKELLLVLGGEQVDEDNVDWDDDSVNGKTITVDVVHEIGADGVKRKKFENIKSAAWDE